MINKMKDPIIIWRGETNIVMTFPILKDENSINDLITKRFIQQNIPYKLVEREDLPKFPSEFYDAVNLKVGFEKSNNLQDLLEINYELAKEIQKNKWREARAQILAKLDIEFVRALETSNVTLIRQITEQKNILRDITNTPLPDDLEDIKNTWPEILGPKPSI